MKHQQPAGFLGVAPATTIPFALSLARDAFLDARPGAVWDNEHPAFLHEDPLQGFFRLILRIFEDGLHEDEVVLERRTEGRISGLVVYKLAGRNGEAMLQLLGAAAQRAETRAEAAARLPRTFKK